MNIPAYGNPLALGHRLLEGLFNGPVLVQEKLDGSQFSFMLDPETHQVTCRSKGVPNIENSRPALFGMAIDTAQQLAPRMTPGLVYRCEAITSPKHNTICYGRIPRGGIILYDIDYGPVQAYKDPVNYALYLELQASLLGIEVVPWFCACTITLPDDLSMLTELLTRESCLGSSQVEGIVIKNLMVVGADKKPLMGKLVRDDFKELNSAEWKNNNPGKNDFLVKLGERYRSEARWRKAVQHLNEANVLEWEPRDIPKLIREVQADVQKECEEEIKQALFDHFWKKPLAGDLTRGLPEWWKAQLIERLGN